MYIHVMETVCESEVKCAQSSNNVTMNRTVVAVEQEYLFVCVTCDNPVAVYRMIQRGIGCNFLYGTTGPTPLLYAAAHGYAECVKLLLSSGANPNGMGRLTVTQPEWTPLIAATIYNQVECVELLLQHKADVNFRDTCGKSALSIAIENGNLACIVALLKYGANMTLVEKRILTAEEMINLSAAQSRSTINKKKAKIKQNLIFTVTEDGKVEVLVQFLEKVEDINAQNSNGETALHVAVRKGFSRCAQALIQKGIDLGIQNKRGFTAMHTAVEKGSVDLLSLLVRNGANVNEKGRGGITPLHIAVRAGHVRCTKILLMKGADVNATSEDQLTPLHLAVTSFSKPCMKLLLEKNANMLAPNFLGLCPLDMAVMEGPESVKVFLCFIDVKKINFAVEMSPIHMAASHNTDSLRLLLEHGMNANAQYISGNSLTPLHVAVHRGNLRSVELLIKYKANLNLKDTFGTPLHAAILMNRKDCMRMLLENGADINAIDINGRTPLHIAIEKGDSYFAQEVIETGSNVNAKDILGNTPLHYAVQQIHFLCIKKLIWYGADIFSKNKREMSPLEEAAEKGILIFKMLICKVDTSTMDEKGTNALHVAACFSTDYIKLVLGKGIDVNVTNFDKCTPLHFAANQGNVDNVMLLIERGAHVNARSSYGLTPLHVAVSSKAEECIDVLIKHGADINAETHTGCTPLHFAVINGESVVEQLLLLGADVNVRNVEDSTPLHVAAEHGFGDCLKVLLQHGANVNAIDNCGVTPFHRSIYNKMTRCIKMMLSCGADVNMTTFTKGDNALHLAAYVGHIECIRLLLNSEVDIDATNLERKTALVVAMEQNHSEAVKLLSSKRKNKKRIKKKGKSKN